MYIKYRINARVSVDAFIQLLREAKQVQHQLWQDGQAMLQMLEQSNLTATAWLGGRLIGMARAITDFQQVCFLADLAVSEEFQNKMVGTTLQALVQQQLGEHCQLITLAQSGSTHYYSKLGFQEQSRCWALPRNRRLSRFTSRESA